MAGGEVVNSFNTLVIPSPRLAIPPTGIRELKINFRDIRNNLRYGVACSQRRPTVEDLAEKGVEESNIPEGFVVVLIKPRPDDVDALRDFITTAGRGKEYLMRGRYSFIYGDFEQSVTCEGVRVGFADYRMAIMARIRFGIS